MRLYPNGFSFYLLFEFSFFFWKYEEEKQIEWVRMNGEKGKFPLAEIMKGPSIALQMWIEPKYIFDRETLFKEIT